MAANISNIFQERKREAEEKAMEDLAPGS